MAMLAACEGTNTTSPSAPFTKPDKDYNEPNDYITPTIRLDESAWPVLTDDLSFSGMELVLDRQLKRFDRINLNKTIKLGSNEYQLTQAKKSLIKFKELTENYQQCRKKKYLSCEDNFNTQMKNNFHAYVPMLESADPRYGEVDQTMFTGYYTPSLAASTVKTPEYKYAVYGKPIESEKGLYSRIDIDFYNVLSNLNLEIFYTNDLFDLYLMHVQGGGHVRFPVKNRRAAHYLSYDGTNGQAWNFISKYMREKNMITDGSIQSQREYLKNNPHQHEEIYASCPSYVYFKKSYEPPVGSDSVPLTDNRSIATDVNHYKFKGLLAYVETERPTEVSNAKENDGEKKSELEFQSFSRFYLDQDTGGAIRGKARVDLYFGEGAYAERAAYNLVRRGDLYFFMLK